MGLNPGRCRKAPWISHAPTAQSRPLPSFGAALEHPPGSLGWESRGETPCFALNSGIYMDLWRWNTYGYREGEVKQLVDHHVGCWNSFFTPKETWGTFAFSSRWTSQKAMEKNRFWWTHLLRYINPNKHQLAKASIVWDGQPAFFCWDAPSPGIKSFLAEDSPCLPYPMPEVFHGNINQKKSGMCHCYVGWG